MESGFGLGALRGKVVLLHFWSYSTVACLRVLGELRRLEHRFPDELVVVGVHSPRFPRERDHQAVVKAVGRHGIAHPVLDDSSHDCRRRYGVVTWPTAVVVDPKGAVVGAVSGAGHGRALGRAVTELVAKHQARGSLSPGPLDLARVMPPPGLLAYPGKVTASEDGSRLAIADTAHDQVLVCTVDGLLLEAHTGFVQPQGVRFDGDAVVVCDSGADRVARTDGVVVADGLAAPWDLVFDGDGSVVVADAGRHRLVRVRPGEQRVLAVAGTGEEGHEDGPATQALLAEPSGLGRLPDGIVFADAGAGALRLASGRGQVVTLTGGGAELQHPLGVAATSGGGPVYVADTLNCRLRVWEGSALRTLPVDGLDEPGGLDVLPDGRLVVADTNNHRVLVVEPGTGAAEVLEVDDSWLMGTDGPALAVRSGEALGVDVGVDLADEQIDPSDAEPVTASVEARPESLLAEGSGQWTLTGPRGRVELTGGRPGTGLLLVEVRARTVGGRGRAERVRRVRHRLHVT